MRVMLLCPNFVQYGIELGNGLAAEGAEVCLVIWHDRALTLVGPDYHRLVGPGVRLHLLPHKERRPLLSRHTLSNLLWIRRTIRQCRPDIVHLQLAGDSASRLAGLFTRSPNVITAHDVVRHAGEELRPLEWLNEWILVQAMRWMQTHRTLRFVTHGEAIRRALADAGRVPLEHIAVIPHGVLRSFHDLAAPPNGRRPEEPGTALFFGRMMRYKGLDILRQAIPKVLEQVPGARFVIAGTGPALDDEREALKRFPQVEILDHYIPASEVAGLFRQAAVVLAAYREATQSGVIASAFAFDVPAIASESGALGEVVKDGENGLLVPPSDPGALARAIVRILSDGALRARLREGAHRTAEGPLSWRSVARQTLAWYDEVRTEASR